MMEDLYERHEQSVLSAVTGSRDESDGYRCECPQSCDEMMSSKRFKAPDLSTVFAEDTTSTEDYYVEDEGTEEKLKRVFTLTPVCGTDGVSYQSECQMRMAGPDTSAILFWFFLIQKSGICSSPKALHMFL